MRRLHAHPHTSIIASLATAVLGSLFLLSAGCGDADSTNTGDVGMDAGSDAQDAQDSSNEAATDTGTPIEAGVEAAAEAGPDAHVDYQGTYDTVGFAGPWGGTVKRVVQTPGTNGRVWAVVGGKLFGSDDDGATWVPHPLPTKTDVTGVLPVSNALLIAGTLFGIYKSTDQGTSWTSLRENVETGFHSDISPSGFTYVPGTTGRLWTALYRFKTTPIWYRDDAASSWTPWNAPSGWSTDPLHDEAHFVDMASAVDTKSGQTVLFAAFEKYFGSGGGVFCSRDSGGTWQNCSANLPNRPFHRVRMDHGRVLVAGGETFGSQYAGVYFSDDLGVSWTAATSGWASPVALDVLPLPNGGGYLGASYGAGLYHTTDLTKPWKAIGSLGTSSVTALTSLQGGGLLAGVDQGGTYASADTGKTWTPSATGQDRVNITWATNNPSAPDEVLAVSSSRNSGSVMFTPGGTNAWTVPSGLPTPRYAHAHVGKSGVWYLMADGPISFVQDGVIASDDQGKTYTFLGPFQGSGVDQDNGSVLELDTTGHLVTAGTDFGGQTLFLYDSKDHGKSWNPLVSRKISSGKVDSLAPVQLLADGRFAVGYTLQDNHPSGHVMFVSPDGNAVDRPVQPFGKGQLRSLSTCWANPDVVSIGGTVDWTGPTFGAARSTDAGQSWKLLDFSSATTDGVVAIATHPYDCDVLFAATKSGALLASQDAGLSWTALDTAGHRLADPLLDVVRGEQAPKARLLVFGKGGILTVDLAGSAKQ